MKHNVFFEGNLIFEIICIYNMMNADAMQYANLVGRFKKNNNSCTFQAPKWTKKQQLFDATETLAIASNLRCISINQTDTLSQAT